MVCKLTNYLGRHSPPGFLLELGGHDNNMNNLPTGKLTLRFGASAEVPWSKSNGWSVWLVTDEKNNYYGAFTFTSDGNQVGLANYAKGDSYYLIEPFSYARPSATAYEIANPNGVGKHPPIISNKGWNNGQGNELEVPTVGKNFWVLDYASEKWSCETSTHAICQATDLSEYTKQPGSRAYPVHFESGDPDWNVSGGVGCQAPGLEGLWQMDIQIGSNGRKEIWCETFYLAERRDMAWGPFNYGDGSLKKVNPNLSYNSREIDILETYWNPNGPNLNLPNGGSTGWNQTPNFVIPDGNGKGVDSDWGMKGELLKGKYPQWSEVGGAPTKDFITFGCLIRGENLWLYAYQGPTRWYCTNKVQKKSTYTQQHPFVPYIGTWSDKEPKKAGGFVTKYRNFIYLLSNDSKIKDRNPYDDPKFFGAALIGK